MSIEYISFAILLFFVFACSLILIRINKELSNNKNNNLEFKNDLNKLFSENKINTLETKAQSSKELEQYFAKVQSQILEHMRVQATETHDNQIKNMEYISNNLSKTLKSYSEQMSANFDKLITTADSKLQTISDHVDKKLTTGFEKTNATFTDIVKRLALIDDAQQKLSDLSTNIISLQDILADKRSRGAFGEVQLKNLITNMLPKSNYSFQYTFKNNNRADCVLFLPEPTGTIAIDSKFPLENYYLLIQEENAATNNTKAAQNFKLDIKRHINAIADKYIIPGETTDAALMFIPAEAVFAEIHRSFPQLVEFAHEKKIFLASPTTMMAILTTASAVIKDSETRKHVHIIQKHLKMLAKDFSRFETRMEKLTNHIEKAREDANLVNTSAKKITAKFKKIEGVEVKQNIDDENIKVTIDSEKDLID